jgi:hypothetical protein
MDCLWAKVLFGQTDWFNQVRRAVLLQIGADADRGTE